MSFAVLYRWRVLVGREEEFRAAWLEATHMIRRYCGSYGARLHVSSEGDFVSYARWPSDEARQACFAREELRAAPCFERMRDCAVERLAEEPLQVVEDALHEVDVVLPVPRLETERLVLRAMRIEDAEDIRPALADPENVRYWLRPAVESLDEVRDVLRRNITGSGVQSFAICEKRDGRATGPALGWVVLIDRREDCAEVGYMTCPHAQGRGLAREAVGRVVEYGLGERELRRIYADTDPENRPSIRLLEALGFEFEGRLRANWKTHLGIRDTALYAKVRS